MKLLKARKRAKKKRQGQEDQKLILVRERPIRKDVPHKREKLTSLLSD